eukprot:GHRR01009316.1.p1 GENE.GHRR01009316.1~~GHRR01009316.1.p1  ORF type:complete len:351 (+),score=99.13 GHRR01009316.1:214-1266(+)
MMLTTPVYCPCAAFKSTDTSLFISSSKDGRKPASLRLDYFSHTTPAGLRSYSSGRKQGNVVLASTREGAEGLPVTRESPEKKKLMLKYVKDVQPMLIEQFMNVGPPAVVAAMRNTVTNMLGTLPPQFFTVTISTVGENMSQLMLSVMMTGYMFRNAQYRLELCNALGGRASASTSLAGAAGVVVSPATPAAAIAPAGVLDSELSSSPSSAAMTSTMQRSQSAPVQGTVLNGDLYAPGVQKSRVQGDVLLWHKENGLETLGAVQYIELLEGEVSRLRQELEQQQQQPQLPKLAQFAASANPQVSEVPTAVPSPLMQQDRRQLPVPASAVSLQQVNWAFTACNACRTGWSAC